MKEWFWKLWHEHFSNEEDCTKIEELNNNEVCTVKWYSAQVPHPDSETKLIVKGLD